ncbi:DUF2997 domain-containing protein [Pseudoalteromonas sp. SG41-1]|uniref:DUF2997 domain-containing protein n=1 Tax=Pseudoalteromonas sp. SG41-1 TaxID=2760979 RepID=UPI0016040B74|nr:DUF2997 domain-containing protein [Pseudoalteromonas sp. SG41-1]MBB1505395.1 DUF2997 domain-containing protein [Pseudoalteromonas sp. SG41-1]
MPEQKIVITIDDDGVITAKTAGFKGESCLEALEDLLELNGVVGEVKKTDEYHHCKRLKKRTSKPLKGGLNECSN